MEKIYGDSNEGFGIILNNTQEIKNGKKELGLQLEKRIPSFLQQEFREESPQKARVIDKVKLLALHYSHTIASCMEKKFKIQMYDGMVLRDFDVTLKMDEMPNITLPESSAGVFLATNYNNRNMQTSFAKCGREDILR